MNRHPLLTLAACGLFCFFGQASALTFNLIPDRSALEAGTTNTVVVKIETVANSAVRNERPPVNLAIVIDKSGSMSAGQRIEFAREGAIQAVRRLSADDYLSLIVFDSAARVLIPAGPARDIDKIIEVIQSIPASGGTNLHGGMTLALEELKKHHSPDSVSRAVILSDGHANAGPRSLEDFDALSGVFAGKGIVISAVGVGRSFNEQLLTTLVRRSEGNNYFADQASSLIEIFDDEIGTLINTVVRNIKIQIEIPEGITVRRVLGRPYTQSGDTLELNFHDLSASSSKYSFVELESNARSISPHSEILRARASFTRVDDGQSVSVNQALNLPFAESAPGDDQMNAEVQQAFAELLIAETQREVLAQVRAGNTAGAQENLRALEATVASPSLRLNATALDSAKAFSEGEAQILSQRSFTRDEILRREANNYQVLRNQVVGRVSIEKTEE